MKFSRTNQGSSISIMDWQIEQLPGLTAKDSTKLKVQGIATTLDLLRQGGIQSQRQALAVQLAIPIQLLNKWVAMADLARIPSVGCQYCGLLLHTGICSTAQLSQTSLHNLQKQVMRLQVQTLQRSDLCPDLGQIASWIQQAQQIVAETRFFPSKFEFETDMG